MTRTKKSNQQFRIPPEFRRLALNCRLFKEVVSDYEAGRLDDWPHALSIAVFALANELDAANRRLQTSKGAA